MKYAEPGRDRTATDQRMSLRAAIISKASALATPFALRSAISEMATYMSDNQKQEQGVVLRWQVSCRHYWHDGPENSLLRHAQSRYEQPVLPWAFVEVALLGSVKPSAVVAARLPVHVRCSDRTEGVGRSYPAPCCLMSTGRS
ncbi:hypothetical protein PSEUDO8O_50331 [Pseudomonas sp. 8O]|nr:hypothetical protein PSEUDO8O_50331 [Pseudomonas sp. 8O]